jgi:hypothetical protein
MHSPQEHEAALQKAAEGKPLSAEEISALREVMEAWRIWKAWGRLGKVVLWVIITSGAIAAAMREIRAGPWFGGS